MTLILINILTIVNKSLKGQKYIDDINFLNVFYSLIKFQTHFSQETKKEIIK